MRLLKVFSVLIMAVGQLPQLRSAPGQPLGERSGQHLGGGLLLQGSGVL